MGGIGITLTLRLYLCLYSWSSRLSCYCFYCSALGIRPNSKMEYEWSVLSRLSHLMNRSKWNFFFFFNIVYQKEENYPFIDINNINNLFIFFFFASPSANKNAKWMKHTFGLPIGLNILLSSWILSECTYLVWLNWQIMLQTNF